MYFGRTGFVGGDNRLVELENRDPQSVVSSSPLGLLGNFYVYFGRTGFVGGHNTLVELGMEGSSGAD